MDSASVQYYCFGVDHDKPMVKPKLTGKRAFLSVTAFQPGGGRDAADLVCAGDARQYGIPGNFWALLTIDKEHVGDRFAQVPSGTQWVRGDGVPVAVAPISTLEASIDLDAAGTYSDVRVWTGDPGGGVQNNCTNWMATSGAGNTWLSARSGNVQPFAQPCSMSFPLICLEY
jgi:hypothetical protein